jgi:signal transduction histidine kinase
MNQARVVYADAARGSALQRFLRHFRSDVVAELETHIGDRAQGALENLETLDVRELSFVRESIGVVWQRCHDHGRCNELVAINVELDHLVAEAARCKTTSVSPELLSAISHDLRNPLGTITLGATLLQSKLAEDERMLRSVHMIHRSASRLEAVLDDVLDVARLQQGSLELDCEVIRAGEIVDQAIDANRDAADEKLVEVVADGNLDGALVWADRERVSDALETVIASAIRASRQGERIAVTGTANGEIKLQIAPVRTLGRLDHFLANGVIATHGGELSFEDSTVTITLPLES